MQKEKLINQFKNFCKKLNVKDTVGILFHTDADGICSAAVTSKAIELLRGRPADIMMHEAHSIVYMTKKIISLIKKNKINKLICVDLSVDEKADTAKQASELADMLVIDHHPIYNDIHSENVVFIKSTLLGVEKFYPASKMVFDLFGELVDLKDTDWIAAAGTIADSGTPQWKDFIGSVLKKYKIASAENIFDTKLGRVAQLITYSEVTEIDHIDDALKVLSSAHGPDDILNSVLAQLAEKVENEIKKYVDNFEKLAEHHSALDLFMLEVKSKYKIKSSVINIVSNQRPNKTIIIYADAGQLCSLSARRQDRKVKVNDLLIAACKDLKGSTAGGHDPAAGGLIKKKDLNKFKENIIQILSKANQQ